MIEGLLKNAFGVPKGYKCVSADYEGGDVVFHLEVEDDQLACIECNSRNVIRKGSRKRRLQAVPIGLKAVYLVTQVPKCECKDCGAKFELPPFLPRHTSTTPSNSKNTRTHSAE